CLRLRWTNIRCDEALCIIYVSKIVMKKIYNNTFSALSLGAIIMMAINGCKVRDDYPVFEEKEEVVIEDIIPPDNNISPVSQKIKDGTTYFKSFLIDSTKTVVT